MIWFIFPSEVTQELMQLKKGQDTTFEALETLANQSRQNDAFNTPFEPKDYNKFTYKFEFSKDLINDGNAENDNSST